MTTQQKSRCWLETPRGLNTTHTRNSIASRIKALIVRLALWGWLPLGLATWIIRTGGLRND